MPYFRFYRPCLILPLIFGATTAFSTAVHSAEWRECEKAKLREIQLQQHADTQKTSKRKTQRRTDERHQNVEEIDTWLWKNCREFSYELRQLEQERM